MRNWMIALFTPPMFDDDNRNRQIASAYPVLLVTLLIGLIVAVLTGLLPGMPSILTVPVLNLVASLGIWALAGLGGLWLVRTGRVAIGSLLIVFSLWLFNAVTALLSGSVTSAAFSFFVLVVMIAGLVFGWQMSLFFAVLSLLVTLVTYNLQNAGLIIGQPTEFHSSPEIAVVRWGVLFFFGVLLVAVARSSLERATQNAVSSARLALERTRELERLQQSLETRVANRTADLSRRNAQLQTAAEIGRVVVSLQSIEELLPRITELISERFEVYHAGIFLIDEPREYAVLRAANSPGGQRMLARQHRLRLNEEGIVGYVTGTGKPRIALDVGIDAVFFNNPDLPETRSELALPLRVRGITIGALDIQSTESGAFSNEDIPVLRVVADLVAVAIENARLFSQEQIRLDSERAALSEVSRERWQERLERQNYLAFRSDELGVRRIDATKVDSVAHTALTTANALAPQRPDTGPLTDKGWPLAVPVLVRGTAIGVLQTHKPIAFGRWLPEEIQLVQAVVETLGVALEGARLYAETQEQAQRNQLRADIAGRVLAAPDVEVILQTAVQTLSEALGASFGAIQLEIEATDELDEEIA